MVAVGRLSVLGAAFACALVLACSATDDAGPEREVGTSEQPASDSIGRFKFSVDTTAAQPLAIEEVPTAKLPGLETDTTNALSNSVMSYVTVTGPGTWNAATSQLTADVVITNTGAVANAFDELQMVLTSLTISGSNPGTVQFTTTNNGNTGVGAVMALADVQNPSSTAKCSSGVKTSAKHHLVISVTNPNTTKFSFVVDARANQVDKNAASVVPDCDGDFYNTEPEDAGNDCNDSNVSIQTGCTCTTGSSTSCTTPGTSCSQSGGSTTCNSGCTCNITNSGDDTSATCTNDCNVTCTGATDGSDTDLTACGLTCTGADCTMSCSNSQTFNQCTSSCTTGADCNVTCNNNQSSCTVSTCSGSSDCTVACTGTNGTNVANVMLGTCGTQSCTGSGTTCAVTCGSLPANSDTTFADCGITNCTSGANCTVTCNKNENFFGGAAISNRCNLGCDKNSTCVLDCSALSVGTNRDNCAAGLTCSGGKKVKESPAGSGKYTCQ